MGRDEGGNTRAPALLIRFDLWMWPRVHGGKTRSVGELSRQSSALKCKCTRDKTFIMSPTIVCVSASAGLRPGCLTAISGPRTGNVAVVRVSKTAVGQKK